MGVVEMVVVLVVAAMAAMAVVSAETMVVLKVGGRSVAQAVAKERI